MITPEMIVLLVYIGIVFIGLISCVVIFFIKRAEVKRIEKRIEERDKILEH